MAESVKTCMRRWKRCGFIARGPPARCWPARRSTVSSPETLMRKTSMGGFFPSQRPLGNGSGLPGVLQARGALSALLRKRFRLRRSPGPRARPEPLFGMWPDEKQGSRGRPATRRRRVRTDQSRGGDRRALCGSGSSGRRHRARGRVCSVPSSRLMGRAVAAVPPPDPKTWR